MVIFNTKNGKHQYVLKTSHLHLLFWPPYRKIDTILRRARLRLNTFIKQTAICEITCT